VALRSAKEQLRRARRDVHQHHLLETAERVFAARGYEGTHMAHIADEAGLALATVYKLAGSKEELYAAVHRERGGAMLDAAVQATTGAGSAWRGLLAGVAAYAQFLVEHPDYLVLHLQESQPWALQPRFISAPQTRLWEQGLELTVQVFQTAIAEEDAIEEDPTLMARLMIAAHQVYLGEWVQSGMKEPPKDLILRMQAHVVRAFGARKRRSS
jgi:AcrR family transcriptional regulator